MLGRIRKKQKSLLVLSTEQTSLIDNMPQIVFVVNKAGEIVYINRIISTQTKESFIGKKISFQVDKGSRKKIEASIKEAFKGKAGSIIVDSVTFKQTTSLCQCFYSPIKKGPKIVGVVLAFSDIIDHQKSTQSEIIESLHEGVFIADKKGRFTYVNQAAAEIYGFTKPEELIGKNAMRFVDPSALKQLKQLSLKAIKEHVFPETYTTKMVTQSGEKKDVEVQITIRKENGKGIGAIGLIRDITAKVEAEKTLHLFMKGFESSPNSQLLIAYQNNTPVIKWVNKAFSKIYGYSSLEVQGKNPKVLSSGVQTAALYKEMWQNILNPEIGYWSGEIVNKKKDGSLINVILTITTIFDSSNEPIYFSASHIDITERKAVEERLSLTQFSMDNSSIPIYMFKKDGSIFYVNNAAINFLGYKKDELLNDKSIFEINPTVTKGSWGSLWGDVSKKRDVIFETTHRKQDGKEVPVEVSLNRIEHGGESFNLAFVRDITEKKLREKQAGEVDKMKSEFVSLASHQLRTPLTAIRWGVEILGEQLMDKMTPTQKSMLDDLNASTKRMVSLVTALLNLSRIESGRLKVDPKKVYIEDIVKEVVHELSPIANARNIQIHFKSSKKKLPKIAIDSDLTREVVSNLVGNAVKYSLSGAEPVIINIASSKDKKEYIISIQDHGIGIANDEQDRIFQKFFRSQEAIAKETDGNGLGLYIAKLIVDQVGARIWFESSVGKGTTFYLAIPKKGMIANEGEKTFTKSSV